MTYDDGYGDDEMVDKSDITPEWVRENLPEVAEELRTGGGAEPVIDTDTGA